MKKDYGKIKMKKNEIRRKIWDLMVERKIARFPFPPHGRIPNFHGSEKCAIHFDGLKNWKNAEIVKINPDSPQKSVRLRALKEGKKLLMPTPRIREGFLLVDPERLSESKLDSASTIKGAFRFGVKLDSVQKLMKLEKVDFIVEGSVAVNNLGQRLGKGAGYGDLEFGMLSELELIDGKIPVVTTVHQIQIVNTPIPQGIHDVSLNCIITPDRVVEIGSPSKRPPGIIANVLDPEKIREIPMLKELYSILSSEKQQ